MSMKTNQIGSQSSRREIADHMNRAFDTSDVPAISRAIGDVVRLYNVSNVANVAGIDRPSVYRAFGGRQSPNLSTVLAVLRAMGFKLQVTPLQGKRTKLPKSPKSS